VFFYVFNFVVIVGVGFLVFCLRRFIQEVSIRNTGLRKTPQAIELRLKIPNSMSRERRRKRDEQVEPTFSIVFPPRT
jgi:hypothetical protein